MFTYDKPIESKDDDFLGRAKFSEYLGKSLTEWKEKESLVVALYGKWGSGKSSIVNLATKHIIDSIVATDKPTIISFNPWSYSGTDKLEQYFFEEIARDLELKDETDKDGELAQKLHQYAMLMNILPKDSAFEHLISKILLVLGAFGVAGGTVESLPSWVKIPLAIFGALLIVASLTSSILGKIADFIETKTKRTKTPTATQLKSIIRKTLLDRKKKLLVVIDDIDRLSYSEIRSIFKLIRVNADFPNTIYLLAFDRNVIESNLEEQKGVSGKEYLEKIVQVNFDVPHVLPEKINQYLFRELNRILGNLPSTEKYFDEENKVYWTNIYHSGFKSYFKSIRDVKRYISSLEFNLSFLSHEKTVEVNPVDFIAIEAIRLFAPSFYQFMKSRKDLFISTEREGHGNEENPRKTEIKTAIEKLPEHLQKLTIELIRRLFPQIDGVFDYGYSSHGHEWQSTWSRELRVCAESRFDTYFTLIPGGEGIELSQFEMDDLFSVIGDADKFEIKLRDFFAKRKIKKVLQRIQDYTEDTRTIPPNAVETLLIALFNISDELPEEHEGMFGVGNDMEMMRIMWQVLSREKDKKKNFAILKNAIEQSTGLFGPVDKVSLESQRESKKEEKKSIVPLDKIPELQQMCVQKIKKWEPSKLVSHPYLLHILYRWKEWDKDESWKKFIDAISKDDAMLVAFVEHFLQKTRSQTFGDYGVRVKKKMSYESVGNFMNVDEMKKRFKAIKKGNVSLYTEKKEVIDLFLKT